MANSHPTVTFRPIPEFTGYRVGEDGSVWTIKAKGGNDRSAGRVRNDWLRMAMRPDKKGYLRVNLDRDGKTYSCLVHQLVLESFIGQCPTGLEACHYPDHNKANNHLGNLRWDTHAENLKDNYRDVPPATGKQCRRCGTVKPVAEFYRDTRASDGLKTECKTCHVKVARESRDPEKAKAANREWMRRHRCNKQP